MRRMVTASDVAATIAVPTVSGAGVTFPANRSAWTATSRRCDEGERNMGKWRSSGPVSSAAPGRSVSPARVMRSRCGIRTTMRRGERSAYIERLLPDLEANDLLTERRPAKSQARIRAATTPGCGARRCRPRSGEHAGGCRGEARGVRASLTRRRRPTPFSRVRPPRFCLRLSPKTSKGRARCLVVPPDQSALSHSGGGDRAGAVD